MMDCIWNTRVRKHNLRGLENKMNMIVRERSRRLLLPEDFRDGAAAIRAKARPRVLISQDRTCETRLPIEVEIPGIWDTSVPVISGTGVEAVCFFSLSASQRE